MRAIVERLNGVWITVSAASSLVSDFMSQISMTKALAKMNSLFPPPFFLCTSRTVLLMSVTKLMIIEHRILTDLDSMPDSS